MLSGTSTRITSEITRQTTLSKELSRLQEDVSTGKRLRVASDDPEAAIRVDGIRRVQADESAWSDNVDAAAAMATRVDASLDTIQTALDRAKELMLTATNGTASPENRAAAARELRAIAGDIETASQQKDARGQPLYPAGAAVKTPIGYAEFATPGVSRADLFDAVPTAGGAKSISDILNDAADALETPDADVRATAGTTSLAELDAAADKLSDVRAGQGIEAKRIDSARERLAANGLQLTEERQNLEQTDYTSAIALIQSKLTTLQAAQAVFAKLNQSSLIDLLK